MNHHKETAKLFRKFFRSEIGYPEFLSALPFVRGNELVEQAMTISGATSFAGRIPGNESWLADHHNEIDKLLFRFDPFPDSVDGKKIIRFSAVDIRHKQAGRHFTGDIKPLSVYYVAVAEQGQEFSLVLCDVNYNLLESASFKSLNEAESAAEKEFEGVSVTWKSAE